MTRGLSRWEQTPQQVRGSDSPSELRTQSQPRPARRGLLDGTQEKPLPYFVYILAARPHGAIYIGKADNLRTRIEQHRAGGVAAHTKKYGIYTLVYFEVLETLETAYLRERKLKRWRRVWKDDLIASVNPEWRDLSAEIPL